mmetsp:Transcript_82254/g.233215  ORF Transcript_82254/g.233215 Transcript_82254/m.233215 type:complete len:212 (-) Transcript_82254:30-665(-)
MAMSAARSLALVRGAAKMVRATAVRPTTPLAPVTWQLPSAVAGTHRPYVTAVRQSRDEVLDRLSSFHAEVISANWADYLHLVYNVPFWEAELDKLTTHVQPYLHEPAVGDKFAELQQAFDVLYSCEDVRDHINELLEVATRASGFMGTGYGAGEKVDNIDEHVTAITAAYTKLLADHPAFKPKIEQTVGHGIAILRTKYKFLWEGRHRYFF